MLAPVTFDYSIRLRYEAEPGAAFVMALLPARTHQQQLATERLSVRGAVAQTVFTDAATATRYLHLAARGGELDVELAAQVRLLQAEIGGPALRRDAYAEPLGAPESLRCLLPSRYCPSDRLAAIAEREFLSIETPLERAIAIERFVRRHLRVRPSLGPAPPVPAAPSGVAPNAVEVLDRAEGTPRDLAHLAIALCRASRLPARYVTAAPFGLAGATDVHPWVEVLVADAWLAFDPSRLVPRTALLRLGTGRDAADVPLAIAHGAASLTRLEWSVACPGTGREVLLERDRGAVAICTATLGSLGEATRWHQQARLAARRRAARDAAADPARPAPSRLAAAAARVASAAPRAGVQVPLFEPAAATGEPCVADEPAAPPFGPV